MLDRKTSEDRVAMVPVPIDHVASIGGGLPNIFRQEFVLGLVGPVFVFFGIPAMPALDLLQKHNVRTKVPQLPPQLMHHQVLMELREPLVDVVGDDVELRMIRGVHDAENILSCAWVAPCAATPTLETDPSHPAYPPLPPASQRRDPQIGR